MRGNVKDVFILSSFRYTYVFMFEYKFLKCVKSKIREGLCTQNPKMSINNII